MEEEFVSKTKRKQEMHALQALGARLVELPRALLDRLGLEERLREAVLDAQRISSHEARRRQIQYIGRLMRETDPAPIRERLEAIGGAKGRGA